MAEVKLAYGKRVTIPVRRWWSLKAHREARLIARVAEKRGQPLSVRDDGEGTTATWPDAHGDPK